ncbi:MAG: ROK family protein [Verrucomicrobiaceae bacterium]|nr:ROK family protein [Verrucomicrobiaceae bacterium]
MSAEQQPLIAAIEAGGTKFVCAVGTGPDKLVAETTIRTTSPRETIHAVSRFLSGAKAEHGPFAAIGIGSFGPVDLHPTSATFGYITTTPKVGWQHTDLVGPLKSQFKVPVGFDTDVNAAVFGEYMWGAGKGCDPLVYITVGTGIGGGVIVNGHLLHGTLHPEIGHLHVPPPPGRDAVMNECQCPFHKNCLEGYASGPAILKRWGKRAEHLPPDHPAWDDVSEVLAHGVTNLILTLSPRRIILGGGVMHQSHLHALIRSKIIRDLNGYLQVPEITRQMDTYLVPPGLGDRSGLLGAIALGQGALRMKLQTRKR